jgi:hypothetical protein
MIMDSSTKNQGITLKSLLVVLILIPINCFWIIQLEIVRYTHPTLVVPLANVIFSLLILVVLNWVLRRFKFLSLSSPELLSIYVLLSAGTALCSHDILEVLISSMGHAFWFATPENEWAELFHAHIPGWLTVNDRGVLAAYYEGDSSFYTTEHLRAWISPLGWWILFLACLIFVMLCINVLLRKQWIEQERLSYPIIQLPLQMCDKKLGFFTNRLMWIGLGIAALINIINGLSFIFPTIPTIPVKRRTISHLFTEKPWNMIGGVRIAFYPFAVGVGFMIPVDLLLSVWVFYWVYKLELMIGGMAGWSSVSGYPWIHEQGFGAYLALCLFALWMGRNHFKKVFRIVFGLRDDLGDTEERNSYRVAVFGLIFGMAFLFIFSNQVGMSYAIIPFFFLIYFIIAIIITRIRAELGFLVHWLHTSSPHYMLVSFLGTRTLGASNLTAFTLFRFFNRGYRSHPMPHQLEGFKLASQSKIDLKRMFMGIMFASVVAAIASSWLMLDLFYRHGADSGYFDVWATGLGREAFNQLQNWLNYPTSASVPDMLAMLGGGIFATVVMAIRTRLFWWPLHPLPYAMAGSWGMFNLWCPLFVAFLAKWIILKVGGLKSYRRAVPFFLGLALGDYAIGSILSILSIVLDRPMYQFWP